MFGTVRIFVGGFEADITSPAQRRIIGWLALSAGEVVSRSSLVDLLWPDNPPPSAVASLQNHPQTHSRGRQIESEEWRVERAAACRAHAVVRS